MSNIDRPLKEISLSELKQMASSLHDAIQTAKWVGLSATAERIAYIRQPIVDEMGTRPRWVDGKLVNGGSGEYTGL